MNEPPRLIDVPFEMRWPRMIAWSLLLVIVATVVAIGVALGLMRLISGARLTSFGLIAGLVIGNGTMLIGLVIAWYFDRRAKMRRFLHDLTTDKIGARVRQLVDKRKLDLFAADTRMFARRLAAAGFTGIVVRIAPSKRLTPIHPIVDVFEPQTIDEAQAGFHDMMRDAGGEAPAGAGSHGGVPRAANARHGAGDASGVSATTVGDQDLLRRLRRNVTLNGGWVALSGFLLLFGWGVYASLRRGSFDTITVFAGVMILLWLALPGARVLTGGRQWLAMPGGVLLRIARWSGGWRLVRFTPANSMLLLSRAPFQEIWFATISDGKQTTRQQFTRAEAEFVLRAWFSPIEPPPMEHLTELASGD